MHTAITVHDDVPDADGRVVDDGLTAFNAAAAPLHDVRPLACFLRADDGTVVGGAIGRTWGACAELQQLWVAEPHRRQGAGAGLLRAFESHAARRGCRLCYLETFSFQAPAWYRSQGYAARMTIEGFPAGIAKHVMARVLAAPPVVSGDRAGQPASTPGGRAD